MPCNTLRLEPRPCPPRRRVRLPVWADFDESQRQLHIRARRFARVAVAEMQLSKPEACRAGREQGDLYLFLKNEIDKAREIYSRAIPNYIFDGRLPSLRTRAHCGRRRRLKTRSRLSRAVGLIALERSPSG